MGAGYLALTFFRGVSFFSLFQNAFGVRGRCLAVGEFGDKVEFRRGRGGDDDAQTRSNDVVKRRGIGDVVGVQREWHGIPPDTSGSPVNQLGTEDICDQRGSSANDGSGLGLLGDAANHRAASGGLGSGHVLGADGSVEAALSLPAVVRGGWSLSVGVEKCWAGRSDGE